MLQSFTQRHKGTLVSIETHDLETGETVRSRFVRLDSVEVDLEDAKNARINVNVIDGQKEIRHILFRPSDLILQISEAGTDAGIRVVSLNTVTTVRLREAMAEGFAEDVA
jgi:hypothetical protein